MEILQVGSEHPIGDFLILGAGFAILQFLILPTFSLSPTLPLVVAWQLVGHLAQSGQ